jgi:hypothetical protein
MIYIFLFPFVLLRSINVSATLKVSQYYNYSNDNENHHMKTNETLYPSYLPVLVITTLK